MTDGEWQAYLDHHPQVKADTSRWPTKPLSYGKKTPISRLQEIQGNWPMKDYMEDGSDSGMTVGDIENNSEEE